MSTRIKDIIQSNVQIKGLYESVVEKLEIHGKELVLWEEEMEDNSRIQFERDSEEIVLIVKPNQEEELKIAVVIHELGEADYIASGLPYIETEYGSPILRRLMECLSHSHINRLVAKFQLCDLVLPITSKKRDIKLGQNSGQNLIILAYEIITYMDRKKEILEEVNEEYKEDLASILGVLDKCNTLEDTLEKIEAQYESIIKIVNQSFFLGEINLFRYIKTAI